MLKYAQKLHGFSVYSESLVESMQTKVVLQKEHVYIIYYFHVQLNKYFINNLSNSKWVQNTKTRNGSDLSTIAKYKNRSKGPTVQMKKIYSPYRCWCLGSNVQKFFF